MAEYIERENAIAWFMPYEHAGESIDADVVISDIKGMKAADVAPVRHGRNINAEWPSLFECSVCGWSDDDTTTGDTAVYNYCPNCGAKMDGGAD